MNPFTSCGGKVRQDGRSRRNSIPWPEASRAGSSIIIPGSCRRSQLYRNHSTIAPPITGHLSLAIAEVIGGECAEKAREAAKVLSVSGDTDAASMGVCALEDIRNVALREAVIDSAPSSCAICWRNLRRGPGASGAGRRSRSRKINWPHCFVLTTLNRGRFGKVERP